MTEVVSKLMDRKFSEARIDGYFDNAKLTIVPFNIVQARAAGLLVSATRSIGASFADRACLALAAARGATTVTADRAWQSLDIGIKIELIR